MNPVPGEESAVVDFTMQLLRVMGYAGRALGRDLRSRKDIPLFICGEWRCVRTDVCVMGRNNCYQLVVQENKRQLGIVDPEPQLIADAIAAVQYNNRTRDLMGLDPLDVKVMAGISMTGTFHAFFKIPVTLELIKAIQIGECPATPTVVAIHRPAVPRPNYCLSEGMCPLDNRRSILACFEAFKQFVN